MPSYSYAPYCRVLRAWLQRRRWRRVRVADRSDGRNYASWTVLVRGEHDGLPPEGTRGVVVRADRQCDQLAHHIEFPASTVIAPYPGPVSS